MSVEIMSRVWKQSEQKGTNLIVLLAIADHADDYGVCWPGLKLLSTKARIEKRQVINVIRKLEESGELICLPSRGREVSNRYVVTLGFSEAEIRQTLTTHDELDLTPEQVALAMGKGATDYTLLKEAGLIKGATDYTNSGSKKVQRGTKKVQSGDVKGATAIAPESSLEPSTNESPIEVDSPKKAASKKPSLAKAAKAAPAMPEVIVIYQEIFRLCPRKETWPKLADKIGDRLDLWRQVCEAWQFQQNNPKNLTGLVDWLNNGIPDYAKEGANNGNSTDDSGGNSGGKRQAKKPAGIRSSGWPIEPDRRYLDEYIASPALGD